MTNPPQLHKKRADPPLSRRFSSQRTDSSDAGVAIDLGPPPASRAGKRLRARPAGSVLTGTRDNDLLLGRAGDDRLAGGDGDDVVKGSGGNDTLLGGAGSDFLYGGPGRDLLYGDDGRDHMLGGRGSDLLIGGRGGDRLYGGKGDDVLDGGAGDDFLEGGPGNDIYLFGRGDGQDILVNSERQPGDVDRVLLRQGIRREQVWFRRDDRNLKLTLLGGEAGSSGSMTLRDWYADATQRVDRFELATGRSLPADKVEALVGAMAGFDPQSNDMALLPAPLVTSLRPLLAQSWQ